MTSIGPDRGSRGNWAAPGSGGKGGSKGNGPPNSEMPPELRFLGDDFIPRGPDGQPKPGVGPFGRPLPSYGSGNAQPPINQANQLQGMFPDDQAGGQAMAQAALAMQQGGQGGLIPGDMVGTYGGAPPPGFDPGRAGGSWENYQQMFRDPYVAYAGSTGNMPGVPGSSGGGVPGSQGGGVVPGSPPVQDNDSAASPADFSADATRMEEATFNRMRNLLDPVFNEQQRTLENRLSVQGLPTGGEAYSRAYDTFNRGRANAFENAALSAIGAGRQEQGRMFGQQMDYTRLAAALMGQDAALQNQARVQGLNEALMQRQLPQQELASLLGTTPSTPYPQFQQMGTFGMQAPDIMGAMNAQSNRQAGGQNALMQGLFGLGSAAILSSRDYKDTIGPVDSEEALQAVRRLPVDRWRYKAGIAGIDGIIIDTNEPEHIGTYAEDFAEAAGVGDGKTISFTDAIGLLTAAVKGLADRIDKMEAGRG